MPGDQGAPVPGASPSDLEVARFAAAFERLTANIETTVRGKSEIVRLAVICLFAEGHLLVEDVPGVGKTTLAHCIAASVDIPWQRIQFTPDLLPSDVTGTPILQEDRSFAFRPGPVFTQILLADEINRAAPKTQSALLEVMQERQVTVDGRTWPVDRPFMVIATQNPVDMQGTYPLPEAQQDRFLMRLALGYPDRAAEAQVLRDARRGSAEKLTTVLSAADVLELIEVARRVSVAETVEDYIVRMASATRSRPELRLGVSPRGSIALMRAAQVAALVERRNHVRPEDVQALAPAVLAHRTLLTPDAEIQGVATDGVIREVVGLVPVPRRLGLDE